MIRLRYFASLREALGPGETVEPPVQASTAGAARDWLIARGGRHAELLARSRPVRCAVNQVMADDSTALPHDAELAFFPPVTGG
jgi:molybdopterin synthase sulfur carrier subunit